MSTPFEKLEYNFYLISIWKKDAVLVFFGVVLSNGAMVVFIGAHCTRRKFVILNCMQGTYSSDKTL